MPQNWKAILLVLILASVAVLPVLAAAGVVHCHDHEPSNHMVKSGFCCTDHTFTIFADAPLLIQDNLSYFRPLQLFLPTYLFVADIFQPPRF
jgi:hypothetical protein